MPEAKNLITTLRQSGMRITPQRRAICRYLGESEAHPTAAMIYAALKPEMPSLSLMTVYNTLNALADLGAIHAIGRAGDDTVHYDPNTEPHVNLVCVSCRKILDVPSRYLQKLREEIAEVSGFEIREERVVFSGLCPACQKKHTSS